MEMAKWKINELNANSRGQAAVTDALYFILIVTTLSIFLFGFANSYGSNVSSQINAESSTTFATNSLKTILYASTPRDASKSLSDDTAEVDYLLSIIKEDYYDDQNIGDAEKKVLGKAVSSILNPVQDNFDYAFYITIPSEKKFVFMYMHITNFEREEQSGELRNFVIYRPNEDERHTNYFCAIAPAQYINVFPKLQRLLSNVGQTSQATAKTTLLVDDPTCKEARFCPKDAQVDLILWDATWLGTIENSRDAELFDEAAFGCRPEASLP